jgi:hypothetical protein
LGRVAEIKLRENIKGFGSSIHDEAESASPNTAVTNHWFANVISFAGSSALYIAKG